jgi:hypothetical protein
MDKRQLFARFGELVFQLEIVQSQLAQVRQEIVNVLNAEAASKQAEQTNGADVNK